MSINGVSTNYYPTAITDTSTAKNTEKASFADTIAEKAETANVRDFGEEAFEKSAPNAPQSVKDAWMEAAKETGANGLGITSNGIWPTEMFIQGVIQRYWGKETDILGSSVESAIQAAQQALYSFDHPLEPNKAMSMEERQYHIKERQFYVAFLEKLEKLRSEQSDGSMMMSTQYKSEIGEYYLQSFNRRDTSVASAENAFSARHVTMSANPSFTVTSYEEIMKNWEEQVKANLVKYGMTTAEAMLAADPQASQKMWRIGNSSKLYTFEELIRYIEEEHKKLMGK